MILIACVHDFGIIDDFTSRKNYEDYTPEKYHCISVDDDIISSLNQNLSIMKTYFHTVKNQECGLVYYGITIIPPESLAIFYETVTSSKFFKSSDELNELALKNCTSYNRTKVHDPLWGFKCNTKKLLGFLPRVFCIVLINLFISHLVNA